MIKVLDDILKPMAEIKQIFFIFAFYLFAQLPAIAVWQSTFFPEKVKILLAVALTGLLMILVGEDYRRKLSLNLTDLGLRFPSLAELKKYSAMILGCSAAGLAWFAIYFAIFHILFPSAYAELMKDSVGILSSLAEWQKNSPVTGLFALSASLLLLAAAEEYLFRGVIYKYLLRSMSWQKAMFWSSACFALFHLKLTGIPIYLVGGTLYCWLYRRTGSLFTPVLAHFLYNFGLVMFGEHLVFGT